MSLYRLLKLALGAQVVLLSCLPLGVDVVQKLISLQLEVALLSQLSGCLPVLFGAYFKLCLQFFELLLEFIV